MKDYSIDINGRIICDCNYEYPCSLSIDDYNPHSKNNPIIRNIYTLEQYRNKGYATKLLKFVLNWKRDYHLTVNSNNLIAVNLYKKLGFEIETDCNIYYIMKYDKNKNLRKRN